MNKKFRYIAVIAAVVLIILLSVFTPFMSKIGGAFSYCLTPVQKGITIGAGKASDFFTGFGKVNWYQQENKKLKEEIEKMKTRDREAKALRRENDSLRELNDIKKRFSYEECAAALVIGKGDGNWFNVFTIDKGGKQGVYENSTVVNSKGLIGRVENSYSTSSNVITIIDANHSVSGMVSRTGDLVQIDGDLTLMKKGLCKMTLVTENADVMIGDTIETSGIGGIYPKGIMIGIVKEFKENSEGTGSYAVVTPYVDFSHMSEVLVIKNGENK